MTTPKFQRYDRAGKPGRFRYVAIRAILDFIAKESLDAV